MMTKNQKVHWIAFGTTIAGFILGSLVYIIWR